ncbi:MAG TPA: hypothetical protein VKB38_22165 [Terracidiphilus sp.]|nr:hypothetical protein [Terracidiphilus sp.]
MKLSGFAAEILLMLAAGVAVAQTAPPVAQEPSRTAWLGVWQNDFDGQPGVIVTLADDTGELGGTVVLNMISRESGEPRVVGSVPHVMVHPRADNETLTFEVKTPRAPRIMKQFVMVLKSDGTAIIHCPNCDVAPAVELTKKW